ncbi:unnamed protein product [Lactuca virosa]|uniref:Transmembrane protein n=1 Tax=Lactuca virosa TaxID=75947 RepID=A0AAU9LJP1_9ASTR|nr:unnamed protein product [Lactuca virosa]
MNLEVDDVRTGQLDISNMVADLKNHFVSLQGAYVKMVFKDNKRKKLMYCVGIVGVVSASVVTFGGGVAWAADGHRFLMKFFVDDLCNRLLNSRKRCKQTHG